MNKNEIVWVLESCLLSYDGITEKDLLSFGCPKELIKIGKELCQYLSKKEISVEVLYGR